jgi:hypothetical protein
MRNRKNADDDPWIGRPAVVPLCGAEKEMQIFLYKFVEILFFDLCKRCGFVIAILPQAIPVQLPCFPIQNLHFALPSIRIFKAVGKAIGQLLKHIKNLLPCVFIKKNSLTGAVANHFQFCPVPLAFLFLLGEIEDPLRFEYGKRKSIRFGIVDQGLKLRINPGHLKQQPSALPPVVACTHMAGG